MLDHDEIEKRLKGVPPELCATFAARTALRVLPFLAGEKRDAGPFWYWPSKDRSKHLLSFFMAQRLGIAFSTTNTLALTDAFAALDATNNTAYTATTAAYNARNVLAHALDAVKPAVQAARNPTGLLETMEQATRADLEAMMNGSKSAFLKSPLWPSREIPKSLQPGWERFRLWAKSLDADFEIWLKWYEDRISGQPIDLELLKKQINIPAEIQAQGPKAVNTYLKNLETQETKPLNLVRAIFIGSGEAGKTSLIRALHGEAVIEDQEKMTPGIDIREWPVGDTGITAHFWDFGGQVMSHATHQFFLRERCLYVLVLNARTGIDANDEAEYWLEHIKAFGKSAAVMLVGNKFDLCPVNLNMYTLSEKYPNIIGFYPISCTKAAGEYQSHFRTFRNKFILQLQEVGTDQVYFTKDQFSVLKAVRKRSLQNAFLKQTEFNSICDERQIGAEGVKNLLDLFDKLGEVIHFPQMAGLDDFVLNPRWLTYGGSTPCFIPKK